MRLMPRQERFFEMFRRSADNVLVGATLLADLMDNHVDPDRKVRKLKDIEHAGDEITHEIFSALDRSFVTPLDRDDIARLATALDDVLDWAEESARRMHVYRLPEPTPLARRFVHVLLDQAHAIARAVPLLESPKQVRTVRPEVVEIHRLENEADDLMTEALGSLYEGVADVTALVRAIQWGDVYTTLEVATDKAEHVGIALESIVMKRD